MKGPVVLVDIETNDAGRLLDARLSPRNPLWLLATTRLELCGRAGDPPTYSGYRLFVRRDALGRTGDE